METVSGPIREEVQYKYTHTYIHEHWSTGPDTIEYHSVEIFSTGAGPSGKCPYRRGDYRSSIELAAGTTFC